jgi:Zn-dependent metalloprotease
MPEGAVDRRVDGKGEESEVPCGSCGAQPAKFFACFRLRFGQRFQLPACAACAKATKERIDRLDSPFASFRLTPISAGEGGEPRPDADGHVTYVFDRDLVRFLKFSGSVMAIFLIVGAFVYGFNLKEMTEEIRKAQKETGETAAKAKDSELTIHELRNEVAKSAQESRDATGEAKKARDSTVETYGEEQRLVEDARRIIIEIRGSREQARTLVADIGKAPPAFRKFGPEEAEQLVDRKIRTLFRHVLAGDQYAKLEKELKSDIPKGLRRAIYDAAQGLSLPGKLVRSEGEPATADRLVTEVYDNIDIGYNFFHSIFSRDIGGDTGGAIMATVHYGKDYDNVFWDGKQLVIGDGDGKVFKRGSLGSPSIVVNNLSHAVVAASTNLRYGGQSGALFVHFSDVFAALAEQWHKKQSADKASWLIGEGILVDGIALRSMKAPGTAYDNPVLGKDNQPDHMSKFVVLEDDVSNDNGGVHVNSGIPNKAFYLLATKIGGNAWEAPGQIWYNTLLRLFEKADFSDCAKISLQVAGELFGSTSTQARAVREAWNEVGVSVKK